MGTWNWDGGNSTAVKSINGKCYCTCLYNSVGKHTIICVGKTAASAEFVVNNSNGGIQTGTSSSAFYNSKEYYYCYINYDTNAALTPSNIKSETLVCW